MFLRRSGNKNWAKGTPLAVHWLRLRASPAGSMGLIPGQGTKILHARPHSQKKKNGAEKKERKKPGYMESEPKASIIVKLQVLKGAPEPPSSLSPRLLLGKQRPERSIKLLRCLLLLCKHYNLLRPCLRGNSPFFFNSILLKANKKPN